MFLFLLFYSLISAVVVDSAITVGTVDYTPPVIKNHKLLYTSFNNDVNLENVFFSVDIALFDQNNDHNEK